MVKKILFVITYALAQIADKLLDFLWIYLVFNQTHNLTYGVIFLASLFGVRYLVFRVIKRIFSHTNFYIHYIYAFTIGFVMVLLVNREGLIGSLIALVILKEFFTAFRIIGTKSYLNDMAFHKAGIMRAVNFVSYLSLPLAWVLLNYFISNRIVDQIYTGFALLTGPAMIVFYNLFNGDHKVMAGQSVNLKVKLTGSHNFIVTILRYLAVLGMPILASGYYIIANSWYGGIFSNLLWQIIALALVSFVSLLLHLLDRFKVFSNKYNEFDNKLLETLVLWLAVVIICLVA